MAGVGLRVGVGSWAWRPLRMVGKGRWVAGPLYQME